MKRQNSQKIMRTKSVSKLSSHNSVQREKNPGNQGNQGHTSTKARESIGDKRKSSVIENMLEKKLAVFKKKQGVF